MDEARPKHRLTPRALLELKVPRAPNVSPDGRRVVFEVSEADFEESRYVTRLWIADVAEGKSRQVTFSYEGEYAPRWSPDGRWIAFLSARPDMTEPPPEDEEDEHKDQLWILPADGGEAQKLTSAKEGVHDFAWAPDSLSLLYLVDEAKPQPLQLVHTDRRKRKVDPVVEHDEKPRRQFWEVGIEEKKPELLYTGDRGIADFAVSPEGSRIAFISNETGDPNDYHRFDLFVLEIGQPDGNDLEDEPPAPGADPQPKRIVERAGAKFGPQWSPDGKEIAFLGGFDPALSYSQECVWTVSAKGGLPSNLFEAHPYDAHDIVWPKEGPILALVSDRTDRPLVSISPQSVDPLTPVDAPIVCGDFGTSPEGLVVAAVVEDDRTPPELYVVESGGKRALTELNKEFTERYALPRQEVIRWQTDGGEIEGIVVHPVEGREQPPGQDNPQSNPLVIQVHGGPKGHAMQTLRSYGQHAVWAAEGYRVLMPNFRGSEGYGHAFAVANRRDLGGGDFRDIMAGVDVMVERGWADPARIGIMGGSYGGFMTNWAIGHSDRFAAAISMFGIFSLVTDFSNSVLSRWDPEYMGAFYWEDPEIYRQCSPSTFLESIRTPVLILHGDSDDNTSISNSREMYQALRARGVTCEFVHYPREGHGVREPNHKLDEMRRCLAWFDRYVKHAGESVPARRLEDRIKHEGYELHVLRVDDAEYAGRTEDDDRLIEVSFSLASDEPVDAGWQLALADAVLVGGGESVCPLAGVPVSAGGGRFLVEGADLTVKVQPDEKSGRLSVALALAFVTPQEGGDFAFRVADFPQVVFSIGPKEEKPEGPSETSHESETPAPSTIDEPALETPREGTTP
jgi:dipeptidyl aminopeptidase/acylaminoacyl peptidase